MMDRERLARMRKLGVRWPYGHTLPRYTAGMSEAATHKADKLYDAISDEFVRKMSGREN